VAPFQRGRHGRVRSVVRFTTTYAVNAYHHIVVSSNPDHGKVYSIQHYPPPIKLTATI